MRKAGFIFAFAVALSLFQAPKAHASVSGVFGGACGSSGVFYTNLTSVSMDFELNIQNYSPDCTLTISWTDASAHPQSLTVAAYLYSTTVSSSLKANGALSWSSSGSGAGAGGDWQLERAPAHGVTALNGPFEESTNPPPCGSSGTVYRNLRSASVSLDLAVDGGSSSCSITMSWTDASGHAQTLTTTESTSPGASTTLPAEGAITWTSTGSGVLESISWQIERFVP